MNFDGGLPPRPWDIVIKPKGLFKDQDVVVEIPNSATYQVVIFME
jgi:hypothetical protein